MTFEIYEMVAIGIIWILSLCFQRATIKSDMIQQHVQNSISNTIDWLQKHKYIKMTPDGEIHKFED